MELFFCLLFLFFSKYKMLYPKRIGGLMTRRLFKLRKFELIRSKRCFQTLVLC